VSTLVVVFLMLFTAYTGFIAARPEPVFAEDPMIAEDPAGVVLALPILCFAFTAHCSLFPVFNSLRRPAHVAGVRGVRASKVTGCLGAKGVRA